MTMRMALRMMMVTKGDEDGFGVLSTELAKPDHTERGGGRERASAGSASKDVCRSLPSRIYSRRGTAGDKITSCSVWRTAF
jgi:hypothetical protein